MVRLDRIYTGSGDDGTTGLGDGTRLAKHHPRVAAYGSVDELGAALGLILAEGADGSMGEMLRTVQNDLFDVGADLSVPGEGGERLRIDQAYSTRLEGWIDEANQDLEPLKSFVLSGGNLQAARLHLARTICRRAERHVCELTELDDQEVNPEVLRYLNRLSDLLFVLARVANDGGKADVLWVPGDGGSSADDSP